MPNGAMDLENEKDTTQDRQATSAAKYSFTMHRGNLR